MAKQVKSAVDGEILRRANQSIASGALTNSKRPQSFVKGVYPTHLLRGQGCSVWDTRNNQYIDFICGLGTNLLGYSNIEVTQAICAQALRGSVLSLGTVLEVETAEKVKEIFPFVDRVRFLKTGSDACNASLKIARSFTGKSLVLSEGYHGWGDDFVSLTPPALGVPSRASIAKLPTDLALIEDMWPDQSVAAIIVEPVMTDMGDERIQFLRDLRDYCSQNGIVLIFDEIITGFRFPLLSVTNYFGIEPDLICLGKAIGNGMPLSVVGGKLAVMEGADYFVSSTFAGETLALAAANKTMDLLRSNKYSVNLLWEKGDQFKSEFNRLWPDTLWIEGYATRGVFRGDDIVKALFFQEACKAGLLFGASWFFNFSHIQVMDSVLHTCKDIINRIRVGGVTLEGEMPASPFAQKVREATS